MKSGFFFKSHWQEYGWTPIMTLFEDFGMHLFQFFIISFNSEPITALKTIIWLIYIKSWYLKEILHLKLLAWSLTYSSYNGQLHTDVLRDVYHKLSWFIGSHTCLFTSNVKIINGKLKFKNFQLISCPCIKKALYYR